MTNEQIENIIRARTQYETANRTRMGVNVAKDQLKTVLFNCSPDLVTMLKSDPVADKVNTEQLKQLKSRIISLESDIESLNGALAEADAENDELRKELNTLRNSAKRGHTKAVDMDGEM